MAFNTPPRNTSFRVPKARNAKTFRMEFDNLGTLLGPYNANRNVRLWDSNAANALVLDELYDFGKKVVVPLYQREAPVKEGGSGLFTVGREEAKSRHRAGFGGGETWRHAGPHLRDRIQALRSRDPLGLTVRMPWYGRLTITGRDELPSRARPYRIELPGGQVIYRNRVGPATRTPLGNPDYERMEWADRAYQALQKRGWFRQLADNLAVRMFLEVMYPLLTEQERRAREKPFLQGYTLQTDDTGYTRRLHHASFSGYKPLRTHLTRGKPHSPAVNRGLRAIRDNRLHRRTEHLRSLQDNPSTRSAANRVRLEHAEALERQYGKYNIPLGRRR